MEELIELLKDGKSRTLEMLASDMHTSTDVIRRDLDYLERTGVIKRVRFFDSCSAGHSCEGCSGCGTGGRSCASCMPEGGFRNMGVMWEVVDT
ncbi:MAG: DeoR family transcriptional regulator [Lachnospiraceae bacterium]|nr:DeoR family transcriptional regulator [Lachnospiraceae bacterium]